MKLSGKISTCFEPYVLGQLSACNALEDDLVSLARYELRKFGLGTRCTACVSQHILADALPIRLAV